MKALVGSFNQEKALVGVISVIVKTDGLFSALLWTVSATNYCPGSPQERFHLRCNQFQDWGSLALARMVEAFYLLITYYVNESSSAKAGQVRRYLAPRRCRDHVLLTGRLRHPP